MREDAEGVARETPAQGRVSMSRRGFLKLTVGMTGLTLLGASACGGASGGEDQDGGGN